MSRGIHTDFVSADDLNAIVGANVRRLRNRAAFSREELAGRASVDWTYLGAIERGQRNPSVAILGRLAAALGVEPSIFFAGHSASAGASGTSRSAPSNIAIEISVEELPPRARSPS